MGTIELFIGSGIDFWDEYSEEFWWVEDKRTITEIDMYTSSEVPVEEDFLYFYIEHEGVETAVAVLFDNIRSFIDELECFGLREWHPHGYIFVPESHSEVTNEPCVYCDATLDKEAYFGIPRMYGENDMPDGAGLYIKMHEDCVEEFVEDIRSKITEVDVEGLF